MDNSKMISQQQTQAVPVLPSVGEKEKICDLIRNALEDSRVKEGKWSAGVFICKNVRGAGEGAGEEAGILTAQLRPEPPLFSPLSHTHNHT